MNKTLFNIALIFMLAVASSSFLLSQNEAPGIGFLDYEDAIDMIEEGNTSNASGSAICRAACGLDYVLCLANCNGGGCGIVCLLDFGSCTFGCSASAKM